MSKKDGDWWDKNVGYVTGCSRRGCPLVCWAAAMIRRFPQHNNGQPFTDVQLHPEALEDVLSYRKAYWLFWCILGDLLDEQVPDELLRAAFVIMEGTPQHTHVVVTKQHERLEDFVHSNLRLLANIPRLLLMVSAWDEHSFDAAACSVVSLGKDAGLRVGFHLEPLLDEVDIHFNHWGKWISWIVAGGENRPGAVRADLDWFRLLRDWCAGAEVPFWLKGLGTAHGGGRELDGRTHDERPTWADTPFQTRLA